MYLLLAQSTEVGAGPAPVQLFGAIVQLCPTPDIPASVICSENKNTSGACWLSHSAPRGSRSGRLPDSQWTGPLPTSLPQSRRQYPSPNTTPVTQLSLSSAGVRVISRIVTASFGHSGAARRPFWLSARRHCPKCLRDTLHRVYPTKTARLYLRPGINRCLGANLMCN